MSEQPKKAGLNLGSALKAVYEAEDRTGAPTKPRAIGFKADDELFDRLHILSGRRRMSKQKIIEAAVRRYLDEEGA